MLPESDFYEPNSGFAVIQNYAGGVTYGASYANYIRDVLVGCPAGRGKMKKFEFISALLLLCAVSLGCGLGKLLRRSSDASQIAADNRIVCKAV